MSETGKSIRTPLIAGNWKMHKTSSEGARFIRALAQGLGPVDGREVMVAPPFTGLYEAVQAAKGSDIKVCAQNIFWAAEGAYTGEVAPRMVADLGVTAVIVGHSERRQHFGETDDGVALKVRAVLDHGMMPIMCVGETEAERLNSLTEKVLATQVPAGLAAVAEQEAAGMTIAYEPVWAIGTGRTATPEIAQEVCAFVRGLVGEKLGGDAAAGMRILYGGSVKPDNIDALMAQPDIDGVLVGGASLDVESFVRIVRYRGMS